jgi:hypothetical protein
MICRFLKFQVAALDRGALPFTGGDKLDGILTVVFTADYG